MKTRLDAFLVANGHVSSREKAKTLIAAGAVTVNGKVAVKAAQAVAAEDTVVCDTKVLRFVGRGGEKLEKALSMLDVPVADCTAMDVGASTGGFTDCLLQAGAKKVFAIDVGTDQLHPSLRADERVVVLEQTDVRDARLRDVLPAGGVDICVVDVSFISLRQVLPAVVPYLREGARVVTLIKPQFEAGKAAIGKRGVVKDPRVHRQVLAALCDWFAENRWQVMSLSFSPIVGGEGNIEFLAVLVYSDTEPTAFPMSNIQKAVEEAHTALKKGR